MSGARYVYIAPGQLINEVTDRWLQLSRLPYVIVHDASHSVSIAQGMLSYCAVIILFVEINDYNITPCRIYHGLVIWWKGTFTAVPTK